MFSVNPTSFGLGALFGGGIGVFATRRFLTEKLRAEIMAEAEKEVESMRTHFERQTLALAERADTRTAEELVKERGYKVEGDIGDTPLEGLRVLRPPVPMHDDEPLASQKAPDEDELVEPEPPEQKVHFPVVPTGEWDFKREMTKRTGTKPYIIHHTEMGELDGFNNVAYSYYPVDNVLVDEDGQRIENVEEVIGEDTLGYFGHGSEDPNVVFVRNNRLRLHIEIQQLPGRSYAVDVLGLSDDQAG